MNYIEFLENDILPVWIKISRDIANGGVFTNFDSEHKQKGDSKNMMCLGRSLWVFSMAYIQLTPKREYLDICKSIFLFLKKCTLEKGKLPFTVTHDGQPLVVTERTYYAEMYCAMGCAQYFKATKVLEVKDYCEKLCGFVYEQYMRQQSTSQEENANRKSKCFGLHMTVLMMTQFVRNAGIFCQKAEELASLAIKQMMESGFVDESRKCVYEHVPLPGDKLSETDATVSCPGHVYEAAWFVMVEGELKNDDRLRLFGRTLLDYAMPLGFEKKTKFIPTTFDVTNSIEQNTASGNFESFPQQEAIIAFQLAHIIFSEKKYLELADQLQQSLHSYYERFNDVIWSGGMRIENGEYADIQPVRGHYASPFHLERYLLVLGILQRNRSILPYMK